MIFAVIRFNNSHSGLSHSIPAFTRSQKTMLLVRAEEKIAWSFFPGDYTIFILSLSVMQGT